MSVFNGLVHLFRCAGRFFFVLLCVFRIRTELIIDIINKFAENKETNREKWGKPQAAAQPARQSYGAGVR